MVGKNQIILIRRNEIGFWTAGEADAAVAEPEDVPVCGVAVGVLGL